MEQKHIRHAAISERHKRTAQGTLAESRMQKQAQILIVDDSRLMLDAVKDHLETFFKVRPGNMVLEANHLNAVKGLDIKRFDLVITDMMVDGRKDGILVTRAVKRLQPDCYVIGMSSDTCSRQDFMEAGADDFFDKGDFGEVRRALNGFFGKRK